MTGVSRPHPAQVPTLTEVIDLSAPPVVSQAAPAAAPAPAPVTAPPVRTPPISLESLPVLAEAVSPAAVPGVSEAQLAHRVLVDVQKQVDGMLEFRLREALAPVLARHTEAIVRDLRDELGRTLKDVVARSVAQELAKLRQR
ncbi:MAG: hypothetical protein I8H76_04340 [Burkholderiales bacterium]|nr:hypothetical protein [Burkholderiales bacterium]MBH2017001.1 hypothetical protein [Burkholderiales bacterium]